MPYREPGRVATEEEMAAARSEGGPAPPTSGAVNLRDVVWLYRRMYGNQTIGGR